MKFKCVCRAGYTGANCDVDINECASQPCLNGDCVDLVNNYKCVGCAELGFTGAQCNVPIDYCATQPCVKNQVELFLINWKPTFDIYLLE